MIHSTAVIHPTAIISDGAQIGENTIIGAYSIIGSNVQIGRNNTVASHVVIEGYTTFGDDNKIFQFASIGANPQDLKYSGEASRLTIGSKNIIREYVTLQPGTQGGGMLTSIGDQNLFMSSSHIAHDVHVGSGCIFANSSAIAGHVVIGNRVIVAGMVGIHQYVHIGDLSMIGAGSMVSKDIPPYCIAQGDRAGLVGVNKIGMERAGYDQSQISSVKLIFRKLFLGSGLLRDRISTLSDTTKVDSPESKLLNFVKTSKRGVCSVRSRIEEE